MAADPTPNPNEKLVRVFDTDEDTEALVVKSLLDSAGIEAQIRGVDNTQDVLPIGGTVIVVREEDEAAARQLLEDYRRSPAQEESEEKDFDETAEEAAPVEGEVDTDTNEDSSEK